MFYADFHVHSKYSRATSGLLDLEHLYVSAQLKGLTVIGTGDFTHPAWFAEIKNKLVAAEEGLYSLRQDIARSHDERVPPSCRQPMRFILVTEISNIYKMAGRTRKNHNLVFLPDIEAVVRFNQRLDKIGNLCSDGRPILGLDSRSLLEIVLETSPQGYLIPAHIWTPWFSLLGSKSGFDDIHECFADLTRYIFAAETGLSSDPAMNWRVSGLDELTLISNSDAHSPSKLGREANMFNVPLSYADIHNAMQTAHPEHFLGTVEFYPEEGKYHFDGHRKCGFSCAPDQTRQLEGACPQCGRQMTQGVLFRVEALADRQPGLRPPKARPFYHSIPLENILSEILQVGPASRKIYSAYDHLLTRLGSEFSILLSLTEEELAAGGIPLLADAIGRMRAHRVHYDPGYDGEFGRVRIFTEEERNSLLGQRTLFIVPADPPPKEARGARPDWKSQLINPTRKTTQQPTPAMNLNQEQQAVIEHDAGPLMIIAGPGTGKTRTITCRIASLINDRAKASDSILAVTFTQKAAQEMISRLRAMISPPMSFPLVTTFHGLCWQLLKESSLDPRSAIVPEATRRILLGDAVRQIGRTDSEYPPLSIENMMQAIIFAKQQLLSPQDDLSVCVTDHTRQTYMREAYQAYQDILSLQNLFDFEDLIFSVIKRLQSDESWRFQIQNRFKYIFIDEFQDINASQYELIRTMSHPESRLCAIGDPDQAIYGFRGSDWRFFHRFIEDNRDVTKVFLNQNYRSSETILESSYQVMRQHSCLLGRDRRVFSGIQGFDKITILEAASAREEAVLIGKTIESLTGGIGFHSIDFCKTANDDSADRSFSDFAILYRTNAQGLLMNQVLSAAGIPCQWTDHQAIQEKPVIAKISGLLRVVADHACYADLHNFLDLISPALPKNILQKFKDWAYAHKFPFREGLLKAIRFPIPGITAGGQLRLVALLQILQSLIDDADGLSVVQCIELILTRVLPAYSVKEDNELGTLLMEAKSFGFELEYYLACQATHSDTDLLSLNTEKVALLTMHAAKGLEFPIVFIAGCEDGLIPFHHSSLSSSQTEEEERRLFFVAMTRAKEQLFLSWARKRIVHGRTLIQNPSPFLKDIERKMEISPRENAKQHQLSLF